MTKFVQLSADGQAVITEFHCSQAEINPPNYAEIADDDPRYLAWVSMATAAEILKQKISDGYVDPVLGVTLAIDETNQGRITSVGAAAGIAVATNSGAGKTFILPTPGAPYIAPDAATAYALSERCREYVQGLIVAAAMGTLTP